jgi:hypothetical protein
VSASRDFFSNVVGPFVGSCTRSQIQENAGSAGNLGGESRPLIGEGIWLFSQKNTAFVGVVASLSQS